MAKKQNKSEPVKAKTGRFEKVNGVVTMLPPEDEEQPTEKVETEQLVVEKSNGTILVQSEFVQEDDLQYVIDDQTEKQSRRLSDKIREENKERAKAASKKLNPERVGNSVVTNSEAFKDIDLTLLNADVQVQSADEKKTKK